jgi:hypothetical protein
MRSRLPLVLALLAACGGATAPAAPVATAPVAPDAAPAAAPPEPEDPLRAQLNLDFEEADGTMPRGWNVGGDAALVEDAAHHGARSLRITRADPKGFSPGNVVLDAAPYHHKRVRLHGWIRTSDVTPPGHAALWLRADDANGSVAFDNTAEVAVSGSTEWTQVTAEIEVPPEAQRVIFGPLLAGAGTAWFDDLRLEVTDMPAPHPVVLRGTVRDGGGAPVAGATVAVMRPNSNVLAHATTAADGTFSLETMSGELGVSAHHAAGVGVFTAPKTYEQDTSGIELRLGKEGGVTVHGRVVGGVAVPAGTVVQVSPLSKHSTDLFAVPVAADGRFEARLPRGERYHATVLGDTVKGSGAGTTVGDRAEIIVEAAVLAPPPPEVVEWLKRV